MASVAETLDRGHRILTSSGVAEPRREAISLLVASTKIEKAFLYAHPEHVLTPDELGAFDSLLERRSNREPLQYIVGVQEFYGLDFEVTPDVLIPRPETEFLVETALKTIETNQVTSFCDLGVGSGNIAISILSHAKNLRAVGLDASPTALRIAGLNAVRHGVDDRLTLIESDLFEAVTGRNFDMIVSNPPYIRAADMGTLQPEVRDFEPRGALTDESDGLSIIRRIVAEAPNQLCHAGWLIMEIGFDQSEQVAALFKQSIWTNPDFMPDLQGIRRVVSACLK